MGWDRPKPKRRTYKSSDYEYRPTTFGSVSMIEDRIQDLQNKIDQLTNSAIESRSLSIYGSMDPFIYGNEPFNSEPQLKLLKEEVQQLSKTVVNKQEEQLLRQANLDPVGFSRLFPDKYFEYLRDDKLDMAIKAKDIFEDTNKAIQEMNLGPKPLENESQEDLRSENARLKSELSTAEKKLSLVVKHPTWRILFKEWFMYKVLKRTKPQPLYLGPYR